MDGLSLAANIIAVASVAEMVYRGLERIAHLREAPQQVQQLLNEVSDFRAVIVTLKESLTELESTGESKTVNLHQLIAKASRTLEDIDKIIQSGLIQNIETLPLETARISWKRWLRKYETLQKAFKDLRGIRVEITSALTLLIAIDIPRVRMNLQNIILSQEQMRSQLLESTNSLAIEINKVKPSMEMMQNILQQLAISDQSDGLPRQYPSSKPSSVFRFRTSLSRSCHKFCVCQCHQSTRANSPRWISGLLGVLFISYSGIPILRNRSCNETSCIQNQRALLQVNYYFPNWALRRMIAFRDHWSPYDGHFISVRTPRLVSSKSEIFVAICKGRLDIVRTLFETGAASPFDCCGNTGQSVLATAVAARELEICAFLLNQFADAGHTDHLSLSAIDLVWNLIFRDPENPTIVSLRTLFEKYFDIFESLYNRKFTILHAIVLGLSTIDLRTHLEYSTADINTQCSIGWSPLFWAVAKSDALATQVLLSYGSDLILTDSVGRTIIHIIAQYCDDESPIMDMVIDSLLKLPGNQLERIINIPASNEPRSDALFFAVFHNKPRVSKLLLSHGALPDAVRTYAYDDGPFPSPFHFSIINNSYEIQRALLRRGAKIGIHGGTFKKTFLHMAALFADLRTLEILQDGIVAEAYFELDPDGKDIFGRTPIEDFDEERNIHTFHESQDMRLKVRNKFVAFLDKIRSARAATQVSDEGDIRDSASISSNDEEFFNAKCYQTDENEDENVQHNSNIHKYGAEIPYNLRLRLYSESNRMRIFTLWVHGTGW